MSVQGKRPDLKRKLRAGGQKGMQSANNGRHARKHAGSSAMGYGSFHVQPEKAEWDVRGYHELVAGATNSDGFADDLLKEPSSS